MKNQGIGGDCLKREGLGQFVGLRGAGQERGGGVYEGGGGDTPMPTMSKNNHIIARSNMESGKINPLSSNPTKWSNTRKQFVGFCRGFVCVCLTILWDWCLKG